MVFKGMSSREPHPMCLTGCFIVFSIFVSHFQCRFYLLCIVLLTTLTGCVLHPPKPDVIPPIKRFDEPFVEPVKSDTLVAKLFETQDEYGKTSGKQRFLPMNRKKSSVFQYNGRHPSN